MNLPKLSIKRPVLTYMLGFVFILFGLISYHRISLDRFPAVEFPMVSIMTTMGGATPEVMDSNVTNIIEKSVNGIPGVDTLTSYSRPSSSLILLKFNLDKNVDVAFNEVQAKINQVISTLPKDADTPIVSKLEVGGSPIMWLVLNGDRTAQELNQYTTKVIQKRLETIDGVGQVQIGGERERTIRVSLNLNKLAAYGLTTADIINAFQQQHVKLPGGFITAKNTEQLLDLDLEYHNINTLKNLIIHNKDNLAVHLSDVATIKDGLDDARNAATFNGHSAIGIGIVKVSGANTVKIINTVKEKLHKELLPQLPAGMHLSIATDDAGIITNIVNGLKEHLFLGTLLAALVVWVFLQSIRSTLIIAITIPVSLLGAVTVMYFSGFTFNVMTLLALLLLIGVVVDDAIVVLENIYRHMEEKGTPRIQAALNGTQEVLFAVLAATLTLVCIFLPVIFLGGIIGRFFQAFAIVVTAGVIISFFVALSLTPMLCSKFMVVVKDKKTLYRFFEKTFATLESIYSSIIKKALTHRKTVLLLTLAVIMSTYFILGQIGKGFLPKNDDGQFVVNFKTPLGSSLSYTENKLKSIEKILTHHKEVKSLFSTIGSGQSQQVNQGSIFVTLVDKNKRTVKQYDLIDSLTNEFTQLYGIKAFPSNVSIVGGTRGEPLQFILRGPDLHKVANLSQTLLQQIKTIPHIGMIDLDLQMNLPEYKLQVDRARANQLGISPQEITQTLRILSGGFDVAKYNDNAGDNDRYNILLKAKKGSILTPDDLSHVYLKNYNQQLVRLDSIATLQKTVGAASIFHSQMQYGAMFFSNPDMPLGDAVTKIQALATKILPPGYTLALEGQAKEFQSTVGYILFAMGMALILVYMVLASQFDSFIQPIIIMIAQPLAIIGGLLALWITGQTLNIYSMIGMVLLMGLVAKNSILLVDLTNQYRTQGMSIQEALLTACPHRMRPVIMTSLTVILAMLPAALGRGAGAESNAPLAIAIIGGMISSTLLTLIVIPSVYAIVELRLEKWGFKKATPILE